MTDEVKALIALAEEVQSWGVSRDGWNAYQADLAKRVHTALNAAAAALEAAQVPATDDDDGFWVDESAGIWYSRRDRTEVFFGEEATDE